jgi:tRNA (adenine-N(1)-)-methyltransferase non-catalytic subunit
MTGRGGAEGYVFVATRVLPAEGKVEARGRPPRGKKAKIVGEGSEKTNLKAATEEEDDVDLPQSPSKRQKTATASQDHLPESSDALTDAVGNAEPDIDTTMED